MEKIRYILIFIIFMGIVVMGLITIKNVSPDEEVKDVKIRTSSSEFSISTITEDGCEYLVISKPSGIGITHKQTCKNHGF